MCCIKARWINVLIGCVYEHEMDADIETCEMDLCVEC